MKPLTGRQQRVLDYISQQIAEQGYPPSVREICAALGFRSSSTAHRYLTILEEMGYLERSATRPRAIRILDRAGSPMHCHYIPLLGRIRAGEPLFAEENLEGYFPFPAEFTSGGEYFILRVEGESMTGTGINDGDYVIVRQQMSVENGEIAALLLGDEATVKRLYREKDLFRLQPENELYKPILTPEVVVLGKVTGLFRRF